MRVSNQLILQAYLVPDISTRLQDFDRLRWERSVSGRDGLYEQATAELAGPAWLRTENISRALAGKSLTLRVHGTTYIDVDFVGPDPIRAETVADLITAASPLLVATGNNADQSLEISTTQVGTTAALEVIATPSELGLLPGETHVGLGTDNALLLETNEYRFADHQSGIGVWYRTYFVDSTSGTTSPVSVAFPSRSAVAVPMDRLIGCYVRLCDLAGRPLSNRRVFVHNVFMPNTVDVDDKRWGVFRQYEEVVTDLMGYAEIYLIRGSVIDVTIGGTGFTRRITLPTVGEQVDLLDPTLNIDDEFGIQHSGIDFAIRTT